MGWDIYKLAVEPTGKERRELGPSAPAWREVTREGWDDIFRQEYVAHMLAYQHGSKSGTGVVNAVGLDAEYRWWKRGRPVYFVDTPDLARKVFRVGLDVTFDEVRLPEPVVAFAFPSNLVIDGVKVKPFLFSKEVYTREPHPDAHPMSVLAAISEADREHCRISLLQRLGHRRHAVFSVTADEHLQAIIAETNPPADGDRPTFDVQERGLYDPLDEDDRHDMAVHCRLALGFACYMRAFPEYVREGFPQGAKVRDIRIWRNEGVERSYRVNLHPRLSGPVTPHKRSGHFRCLRSERYRRNEDGSCRIVYVTESWVSGRNVDPSTVEDGGL